MLLAVVVCAFGAWVVMSASGSLLSAFPFPSVLFPEGQADWHYIVLHHSATDVGNAESFGRYHREDRGWENGLGYHFVIGNGRGSGDGKLEIGERWLRQLPGAHAGDTELNRRAIGICLVGDFRHSRPTRRQLRTLMKLLTALCSTYGISPENVLKHSDVALTECPGKMFPGEDIKRKLQIYLDKVQDI